MSREVARARPEGGAMTERQALLCAATTSLTWGLTGVFVRLLPAIPPLTIAAGRLVIALAAVLPVLALSPDTRHGLGNALRYPCSFVLALLLAGYYLLATTAFQMAPVAEVALLLSTPPLFVLVIRTVRGEPSSPGEIRGAVLAVSGIALILAPKMSFSAEQSGLHFWGNVIAICASASTAIYAHTYRVLAEQKRAPQTSGVSVLTFAMGGAILTLAAGLAPTSSGLAELKSGDLPVFLALGVLSTAVPTLGFAMAAKRLPAIITATISLFIPLFSGFFAYLILGERLSALFVAGCALVLWGVSMIARGGRKG
jgi:drug/metabolite transporter (DMT)-like permease